MKPDEPGSIFKAPAGRRVEEPPQPTVDGSDEARRRLRHPFDVPQAETPDGGSTTRPEPDEPAGNTDG